MLISCRGENTWQIRQQILLDETASAFKNFYELNPNDIFGFPVNESSVQHSLISASKIQFSKCKKRSNTGLMTGFEDPGVRNAP